MKLPNSNDVMKPFQNLLLLACLFGFAIAAAGTEVDAKTAATAVQGWLKMNGKPLGEALGGKVTSTET